MDIKFDLVYFDSYGAKSSCTLVKTDKKILIDPGVAVMHPSFPGKTKKIEWFEEGKRKIKFAANDADAVVISHYHYDHFTDFDKDIYINKTIFLKNPNEYINDSQRLRAEKFFQNFCKRFGNLDLSDFMKDSKSRSFEDPLNKLEIASKKSFGDYQRRREELLSKGKKWFLERTKKWCSYKLIPEMKFGQTRVKFADGRRFRLGKTKIRFTEPLFHGIEYSRVGWVLSTIIEYGGEKFMHTSDLNGPIIEDYAELIINENPDYVVLDGPMTYMLGYTLNLINFRRVIQNMLEIIERCDFKLLIWDHHLVREPKFRERTKDVWIYARKCRKNVLTAREYTFGVKPVVEEFVE